jgi:hypothetical protein
MKRLAFKADRRQGKPANKTKEEIPGRSMADESTQRLKRYSAGIPSMLRFHASRFFSKLHF